MPIGFVPPFPHNQEGNFGTRTLTCNGEERPYADLVRWTILTGMAYLPATVPPIGRGASGLPISFQVVGAYGADYLTIRLADASPSCAGAINRRRWRGFLAKFENQRAADSKIISVVEASTEADVYR